MSKVSRRNFLRTVVVSATAVGISPALGACDGPGNDPDGGPGDSGPTDAGSDGGMGRPVGEAFPQSVASGDPRPDSIILWTRAVPVTATESAGVTLEMATDSEFANPVSLTVGTLTAEAAHDHCLRIKVEGLTAGTTYYYRFSQDTTWSNTGRFRTAPAATADEQVRFAVVTCQDYIGRHYNSYMRLLEDDQDDLAFVAHLGDYVYETTGDPGFQMTGGSRGVTFREPDEAIEMGEGEDIFYAARSVSNYRDLYRTYRSDPIMQQVHERFAFISVWDDHEFSDDCWQDNGTYTDGVTEEADSERRINSEEAYFDYMPIALDVESAGTLSLERAALYPNTAIYRNFQFGQHMSLAMTDYRSFRPDHPTSETAFPGTLLMDETQVRATISQLITDGQYPAGSEDAVFAGFGFRKYLDVDTYAGGAYQPVLLGMLNAGYVAAGVEASRAGALATAAAQGNIDAEIFRDMIIANRDSLPPVETLPDIDLDVLPDTAVGLPAAMLGKSSLVGQLGSRYLVIKPTYDFWNAYRTRVAGDTAYDDVLGATQEAWLTSVVEASTATWNVVGNSVCNTSQIMDLSSLSAALAGTGIPATAFYLNVDQWDGFPERRKKLMEDIYQHHNCVLLAGDIHAAYTTSFEPDAEGNRVLELTTPGISSGTFQELLMRTGNRNDAIRESGLLGTIVSSLDGAMPQNFAPMEFSRINVNGLLVVTLTGTDLVSDWYLLPPDAVEQSYYERAEELATLFTKMTYAATKESGKNSALTLQS